MNNGTGLHGRLTIRENPRIAGGVLVIEVETVSGVAVVPVSDASILDAYTLAPLLDMVDDRFLGYVVRLSHSERVILTQALETRRSWLEHELR